VRKGDETKLDGSPDANGLGIHNISRSRVRDWRLFGERGWDWKDGEKLTEKNGKRERTLIAKNGRGSEDRTGHPKGKNPIGRNTSPGAQGVRVLKAKTALGGANKALSSESTDNRGKILTWGVMSVPGVWGEDEPKNPYILGTNEGSTKNWGKKKKKNTRAVGVSLGGH